MPFDAAQDRRVQDDVRNGINVLSRVVRLYHVM
jgi:hypothetical protein